MVALCGQRFSHPHPSRTRVPAQIRRPCAHPGAAQGDDLAYVVDCVGEDHITVGTDYGHADYSNDIEAIQTLAHGGKIGASFAQKILDDNPRRLYGL